MPQPPFLEIGQIVGTHGVRGELRVQPWCDAPQVLASFRKLYLQKGEKTVAVRSRVHKTMVLMTMEGVDTVEQAQALKNEILWLRREDMRLPKGKHFVQDIIGCHVFDCDSGEDYGVITDVSNTGANDIYHLRHQSGEVLIPAIKDIVLEVSPADDRIIIRPMKGLFDDED